MALLSDPIVRLLLGDQWLVVIPILPWVFVLAGATSVFQALYRLLLGHNQQRHCLGLDAISIAGVVFALAVLLPGGLESYIKGLIVVQLSIISISSYWLIQRGGIAFDSLVSVFAGPVVPIGAAWFAFVQAGIGFEGLIPSYAKALVQIACYMLMYILMMRLFFVRQLMEMVPYFPLERPVRRLLALSR